MSTCPHGELRHTCYACDLEAERDRLRAVVEAVRPYTKHLAGCGTWTGQHLCSCGLDELLDAKEGT